MISTSTIGFNFDFDALKRPITNSVVENDYNYGCYFRHSDPTIFTTCYCIYGSFLVLEKISRDWSKFLIRKIFKIEIFIRENDRGPFFIIVLNLETYNCQ